MQGYALLCVGFPSSDLEVETQDEDEVNLKVSAVCSDYSRSIVKFSAEYNNSTVLYVILK